MEIRDARPDDVPAMAAIYDEAVRTSVATFDLEPVGHALLTEKVAHAQGSDHVLVALVDGEVVGYAYAGAFRPRPAYAGTKEVTVYLASPARGRGVGRALYDELLRRLDADPAVHTQIAVVALPNPASEALHRSLGFAPVGTMREVGHKLGRWVDVAYLQRLPEHRLPGGNVGGAVRVGGTVRRRTGPWTPAVHALLDHLATAGLDRIPRVHGIDESGREILDFLPGSVPEDPAYLTDGQLVATARWLARLHAATADFPADERRWYFTTAGRGEGQVICHHDVAPYNLVFDGDELAGVFDWDLASPGHPWDDVAFLAWNALPLLRERDDLDAVAIARRLGLLLDAYGDPRLTASEVLDRAIARMELAVENIAAGQRAGDEGMLSLGRAGEPAATRVRIADALTRLPAIRAALG